MRKRPTCHRCGDRINVPVTNWILTGRKRWLCIPCAYYLMNKDKNR